MTNLYEYLTEGVFDIDDNIDKVETHVLAKKWIDEQSKSDSYSVKATKWEILKDGSVKPKSSIPFVGGNVPKHIHIVGDYICFLECSIECLDSISCNDIRLENTTINDYGKGFKGKSVNIESCDFIDFEWLPKKLESLSINHCSFKKLDLSKIITTQELNLFYIDLDEIENIKSEHRVYIKNCDSLKSLKNIECTTLDIQDCAKFEGFKGDNNITRLCLDASCKKFKPINLPTTIKYLYCNKLGKDWIETNVMALNPDLKLERSEFPDTRQWKSDIDLYKPGTYVCVKGKPKYSGPWGTTRGVISVDIIDKVTASGKIKCENAGLRPAMDVELMRDANPKKDWNYKDPNGINDVTGVGIEVGDEVIVYPKGKSHLELDKVIRLTKASVRCEKCGVRGPENICIMRGQKECERLFK